MNELILGIESSCDDTSLALVNKFGSVIAQAHFSQEKIHQQFGGVVPEVASRSHFQRIEPLFGNLLEQARGKNARIKAVAATCAPGLVGPLLVGASFGKGLAHGWQTPFIGVHHLRAHIASVFLEKDTNTTLEKQLEQNAGSIVLLVSGGHTKILRLNTGLSLSELASTSDDAAGECFDKSAKVMGLPYPGGPSIEKLANTLAREDLSLAQNFSAKLPRPKSASGFSFAGLKTAIRLLIEKTPEHKQSAAMAWAIEDAIGDSIIQTLKRVAKKEKIEINKLIFCGGVSANLSIRTKLSKHCSDSNWKLQVPPLKYSTDNASMISACAWMQDKQFELSRIQSRLPL